MRAARGFRRFQGTQLFSQIAKQGISLLVLTTYLTLISAPAAAAVRQEVFGRPKPLTENSIAQGQLAQMREAMRKYRLEQRLTPAPTGALEKLKGIFTDTPQVKAERALADTLLATKAKLLSEAGEQDAAMAATRAQLLQKHLPPSILARHDAAMQTMQQRRAELLSTLDQLQQAQTKDNSDQRQQLLSDLDKKLEQWGGEHAAKTDFKHLPWGSPSNKVRAPHDSEFAYLGHLEMFGIRPLQLAYAGSMPVPPGTVLPILPKIGEAVQPADLAENEDIQLTPAIQDQAAALHHNPSEIYRWVHDNVEYIPTYGSIQGADYTLQAKRGNAFDTSSLLIALLRASGIPARYVYGTVEVPVAQAMNWVGGVTSPDAVLNLMGQGGIPNIGLTQGGKIVAVRLEHVWVEAFIDFVPSRGVVNKVPDTWIPLDASFKQYTYTAPLDIKAAVPFDAQALITDVQSGSTIDETQGYVQNVDQAKIQTALTNYQAQVQNYLTQQQPNATVGDVLGTKTIQPYPIKLLSQTLPLKLVTAAAEFQTLPDTMRHYFNYAYYGDSFSRDSDSPAFQLKLSLPSLAGKALALSFRPATPDDEATINSYLPQPHADGTPIDPSELPSSLPGYLINVKPELTVDGQVIAAGDAVMLGSDVFTRASITSPNSDLSGVTSENRITAGEYHAIGIDGQGLSATQLTKLKTQLDETKQLLESHVYDPITRHNLTGAILQTGAQGYFAISDWQNQITAQETDSVLFRLPSYGSFSSTLKTIYSWGIPSKVATSGVTMDMDKVISSLIDKEGDAGKTKSVQVIIGNRMSENENRVPEHIFSSDTQQVEGISAIKALRVASQQGQRIYAINKVNASFIVPTIAVAESVKEEIINATNAGFVVTIGQQNITYGSWTGVGYIVMDPETLSGAYKISGSTNGGAHPGSETIDLIGIAPSLIPKVNASVMTGPLLMAEKAIELSLNTVSAWFKCYQEEVVNVLSAIAMAILIALAVAALAACTGATGGACGGAVVAFLGLGIAAPAYAATPSRNCTRDCTFATPYHFASAYYISFGGKVHDPITDPESFKREHTGSRNSSSWDICACRDDESLIIYTHGQCTKVPLGESGVEYYPQLYYGF